MNLIKLLQIAALLLSVQVAFADPAWKPNLSKAKAAFEKETGITLRAGHRIEPTIFSGYYAVRSGQAGKPSAYFREDMVWLGNVKLQGWAVHSPSENSLAGRHAWLQKQLKQIPLDQLILVKRAKPPTVVVWSAPDCPFCRKLEKTLAQEDVSAYVVPVGVSEKGFQQAAQVYCANNPSRAWTAVMEGTEINDQVRSSCVYPRDMLNDIGFFFGMGRMATPIVIFADGATVIGWNDQGARMLLQEKIKDQIFYPTIEARGSHSQR
jgi:hypothetical protein